MGTIDPGVGERRRRRSGVVVLYLIGTVLGLALAIVASRRALDAALTLGTVLGFPPFLIGVSILAVGTDLPEIANSLLASATGHGDLNVGDSHGSVVTQLTLVLGLLCLSGRLSSSPRTVIITGSLTVGSVVLGSLFFLDGRFGRLDGFLLVSAWLVGSLVLYRHGHSGTAPTPTAPADVDGPPSRGTKLASVGRPLAATLGFLAIVGLGSAIAVESFTRFASGLGAPEYLLSFFLLALGTSLPELVVDGQAIRRARADLAMGDILGSSFVDATLSPGIGPLFFPTALSAGLVRGGLIVAVVVAVVTAVLSRDRIHSRTTGVILILLYLGLYPALVG